MQSAHEPYLQLLSRNSSSVFVVAQECGMQKVHSRKLREAYTLDMFYISATEKWSIPRTFNNASDLGRLLTGYTFLATIGYLQSLESKKQISGKVDTKTVVAFFLIRKDIRTIWFKYVYTFKNGLNYVAEEARATRCAPDQLQMNTKETYQFGLVLRSIIFAWREDVRLPVTWVVRFHCRERNTRLTIELLLIQHHRIPSKASD